MVQLANPLPASADTPVWVPVRVSAALLLIKLLACGIKQQSLAQCPGNLHTRETQKLPFSGSLPINQERGTLTRSPPWVAGTQRLEPWLKLPRMH